jgi:hypothetical protein
VFRRIAYLALFGFLAIFLLAPILTLLSLLFTFALVILSFAFVGFIFWLPFQALGFGFYHGSTWRDHPNPPCRFTRKVFATCGVLCTVPMRFGQAACQHCRVAAQTLAVFVLEMVSGALVALLVVLLVQPGAPALTYVAAGGVGAVGGFLVVLARRTENRVEIPGRAQESRGPAEHDSGFSGRWR